MRSRVLGLLLIAACEGSIAGTGDDDGAPASDADPGGGARPDAAGGVGEPAELAGMTLFHNEVRAAVDTQAPLPALTWSPALAATAAAWVAQCRDVDAPTGLVDHNPGRSNGHPYYVGENIFASGGGATAKQAVQLWAGEKANYNYTANTCNGVCGHYTQLVWRDTREVGCAVGTCPGLQYPNTIVCNYGPGGNVGGQRPY
ncbi:MAG: hypothetical protein KIT31_36880 [Deltaproteobacteria bacterium]|nr:hypothetical protein [Deltaproteobacteria bacterium]